MQTFVNDRYEFLEDAVYDVNMCALTGEGAGGEWTEAMKKECVEETANCHKYLLSILSHLTSDRPGLDPRAREIDHIYESSKK